MGFLKFHPNIDKVDFLHMDNVMIVQCIEVNVWVRDLQLWLCPRNIKGIIT